MKLSAKSWHYKLVKFYFPNYTPANLCPYFWSVILCLFASVTYLPLTLSLITLATILMFVSTLTATIISLPFARWRFEMDGWAWFRFVPDSFRFHVNLNLSKNKKDDDKPAEPEKPKEKHPSLLWAWLMSKKHKMCPVLEIVDKKEGK